MKTNHQVPLAEIPGNTDAERLLINHCTSGQQSWLELHQQSWSDDLGWYTQSRIRVEPHQLSGLRQLLPGGMSSHRPPRVSEACPLRVVQAESA